MIIVSGPSYIIPLKMLTSRVFCPRYSFITMGDGSIKKASRKWIKQVRTSGDSFLDVLLYRVSQLSWVQFTLISTSLAWSEPSMTKLVSILRTDLAW